MIIIGYNSGVFTFLPFYLFKVNFAIQREKRTEKVSPGNG